MSYNHKYSKEAIDYLYMLGVFIQPDNSIALSKTKPKESNEHDLEMFKFDNIYMGQEFLEEELKESIDDYVLIWKDINELLSSLPVNKEKHTISDDLFVKNLDSLIRISSHYKDLEDVHNNLTAIKNNHSLVNDSTRALLIYYTTVIELSDYEIVTEYNRLLDIISIKDKFKVAKTNKKYIFAGYSSYDSGLGGRGRNGWGPFSGFDYADDRVMDGREIGEGKGHATEKFKTVNKFKRHPELNRWKSYGRYRTKPLRYKRYFENKINRKKKRKKRKKDDLQLKSNGLIYTETVNDPAYIYWIDQQRNNPWGWNNRTNDSAYPSWSQYGSGYMSR